jgi:hypothetical protein
VDQPIFLAGAMILSAVLGHWLWLGLSKRRSGTGTRGAVDLVRARLMQWSIEGLLDADALSRLQCRLDQEVALGKNKAARSRAIIPQSWLHFLDSRRIPVADFSYSVLVLAAAAIGLKVLWPIASEGPLVLSLLVFSATLFLFSAARYSLHEWRWRAFSHTTLLMVTLLVPVNFFLLSRLTSAPIELFLGVGIGLSLFAILTWIGREFLPADRSLFAMVVGGTSLSQLLWPRLVYLVTPAAGPWLMVAACLPVACHGAGLRRVFRAGTLPALSSRSARGMVYLVATGTFAVLAALLFLAGEMRHVTGRAVNLQSDFALPITLMAAPLMLVGMTMSCDISLARHFAPLRWCGVIASAVGAAFLSVALALAWGQPLLLMTVAAIDCVVLSRIALRYDLRWVHLPALCCLSLVLIVGFHAIRGHLSILHNAGPLVDILMSQESGIASMAIVAFLWACRGWWLHRGRGSDAAWYTGAACVMAACGLLAESVSSGAMQFSGQASLVFGFYGVALLAANRRWRRALLTSISMSLFVGSLLWLLWLVAPGRSDLWALLLATTALLQAIIGVRCMGGVHWRKSHGEPILRSAQALGLLAISAAGYTLYSEFNCSWTVSLSVVTVAATWAIAGVFSRRAIWLRIACATALAAVGIALGTWGITWDQGIAIWTLLGSASLMLAASAFTRISSLPRWAKCGVVLVAFGRFLSLTVPVLLVLSMPMPLGRFTAAWLWLALLWYIFAEAAGSSRLRLCWQSAIFVAAVGLANMTLSGHALIAQAPQLNALDYGRLKAAGIGLAGLASVFALARAFHRLSGSTPLTRLPALDWGMLCLLVAVLGVAGLWIEACALARPFVFVPFRPAWGSDGTWLLCLTALCLIISLWTSRAREAFRGLLVIAFVAVVAAINGTSAFYAAPLWFGWGMAILSLIALALTWSRARIQAAAAKLRLGPIRRWHRGVPVAIMMSCVPVLLAITATPFFTTNTAVLSPFASPLLFVGPTILVGIGLVGNAIIEGSAISMSGSLLAFAIAAIAQLLWRAHQSTGALAGTAWPHLAARLLQITGTITAMGSLLWLVWLRRRRLPYISNAEWRAVKIWNVIGPVSALVLIGISTIMMLHAFPMSEAWIHSIGSRWTWWLVGLSILSWLALAQREPGLVDPRIFMFSSLAVLALTACTIERLIPGGGWGYRTLILLWATPALIGWLRGAAISKMVAAPSQWVQSAIFWSRMGVAASVLLGLHAAFHM